MLCRQPCTVKTAHTCPPPFDCMPPFWLLPAHIHTHTQTHTHIHRHTHTQTHTHTHKRTHTHAHTLRGSAAVPGQPWHSSLKTPNPLSARVSLLGLARIVYDRLFGNFPAFNQTYVDTCMVWPTLSICDVMRLACSLQRSSASAWPTLAPPACFRRPSKTSSTVWTPWGLTRSTPLSTSRAW